MSEGRTWRSEDTRVFSFKVFFGAWLAPSIRFTWLSNALTAAAVSEAERIVFAAEGFDRELSRTVCSLLMTSRSTAESGFNPNSNIRR